MREGELRLEVLSGTTEGYGRERAVRVYESSLPHAVTGERLVTIVFGGEGTRLTRAQVAELYDWLGRHLEATA